jgi:hypothetical protein
MDENTRLIVIEFLDGLLTAAEKQRDALKDIKPLPGSNYVGNQYIYWKNASSAFRWAIKIALQTKV